MTANEINQPETERRGIFMVQDTEKGITKETEKERQASRKETSGNYGVAEAEKQGFTQGEGSAVPRVSQAIETCWI